MTIYQGHNDPININIDNIVQIVNPEHDWFSCLLVVVRINLKPEGVGGTIEGTISTPWKMGVSHALHSALIVDVKVVGHVAIEKEERE